MNIDSTTINQFVAFRKFANNVGNAKAVAQLEGNGPVSDITRNTADKPYAWGRSSDNATTNLNTRALFRKTVENMFGGADKIPQTVKDKMELSNFNGQGRPLTARRINNVKEAIPDVIRNNPNSGVNEGTAILKLNDKQSNGLVRTWDDGGDDDPTRPIYIEEYDFY